MPDPIGQALLASQPASPAPSPKPSPPSAIACPHCGGWLLEPWYTMPTACTLIPSNLARLRAALRRYRDDLGPALYFRVGQRLVRIIPHGDLILLRQRMTVAGYMKSQRIAA